MPESNAGFQTSVVIDHLMDKAERFVAMLPLFGLAIVVLALAWVIGSWLSKRTVLSRISSHNPFLQDLLRTAVRWGAVLVGAILALEILGATKLVGAVLGTAGVLGVALGFAFKDILENYLAGLLLSLRQPFAPKDWVVIDGNEGVVVSLTSRATILMTLDGNHLRLPNATVFRGVILNYTRNPKRRLDFKVGIGVNEDIAHAQRIGMAELERVPGVIGEPPPRGLVTELGDWNVTITFQAWVDQRTHDFLLVKSEGVRMVKGAFEREGIDMPFPTYDVDLQGPRIADDGGHDGQPAPERRAEKASQPAAPAIDTRRTHDVLAQVDAEREDRCGTDLLQHDAPKE